MPGGIAADVEELAREYGLRLSFPRNVVTRAGALLDKTQTIGRQGDRADLRSIPFVTIDGADAKDFDDAVHCVRNADEYVLSVAIADVGAYVAPGDDLDEEARARGTSAYFPGLVLPMFPAELSENLCSLLPGKDRLCLVCLIRLSADGEILSYKFREGLIRSHRRLTYKQSDGLLKQPDQDRPTCASLACLATLSDILGARRDSLGALKIDLPALEPKVKGGKLVGLELNDRTASSKIIEECMLAVNVCAAEFLGERGFPLLYRVHGKPSEEGTDRLCVLLSALGVQAGAPNDSRFMQNALDATKAMPPMRARALVFNILRTLQRAEYTSVNKGHFGLGYASYAHATSPIRRYPDLLVHRGIKAAIRGQKPDSRMAGSFKSLGEHCTAAELGAERAERSLLDRLAGRMQAGRVGNEIDGVISGIAKFGMFVLFNGFAEGLLPLSKLKDDYYVADRHEVELAGRRTGRIFRIGDCVRVILSSVNEKDGRCRLKLAG